MRQHRTENSELLFENALKKENEKKLKKLLTNEFRHDNIIKLTRESGTTKETNLDN